MEKSRKKDSHELNIPGLRTTNQRALILGIIRQGHEHLDADEIYRLAREKQPRISLSTVYRTLNMLKKQGLIEELHFDDEHHHYEIKPPAEHYHFTCLDCGRVVEFRYPLARLLKKNVSEVKDFEIANIELRMSGYCDQCRQKKK